MQLLAVITPPVINHLSCYGTVFSCPSFCVKQECDYASVTKQELPKYKAEQPPTYQIDSLKRDVNKKLFGKADTLLHKILSCSRMKLSTSQTKVLDVVDTGVLISEYTLHLRRRNVDVPDIYSTLLDAAGISPWLDFNQIAEAKDRGSCIPFNV